MLPVPMLSVTPSLGDSKCPFWSRGWTETTSMSLLSPAAMSLRSPGRRMFSSAHIERFL